MVKDAKSGVSYQEYGHISDLTDYLICYLFKDDYSQFQNGGVTSFARPMGRNVLNERNRM